MVNTWEIEVARRERFEFGKNWQRFLLTVDDSHIGKAERSLQDTLGITSLEATTFLDVGSGSGLFSLAAMRLGAERVHSFDYDLQSVACTRELRQRHFPEAGNWTIEQGSVLDVNCLSRLAQWGIVYSWGVLHHTGNMWQALENVGALVQPDGLLFMSLYNDQGWLSQFWKRVKLFYNRGSMARLIVLLLFVPTFVLRSFVVDILHLKNPLTRYRNLNRGMSIVYDWLDWLGGYPFEVAKPDKVIEFYRRRGFELTRSRIDKHKSVCNEFVFRKMVPR